MRSSAVLLPNLMQNYGGSRQERVPDAAAIFFSHNRLRENPTYSLYKVPIFPKLFFLAPV
jgi:hypothetical protein